MSAGRPTKMTENFIKIFEKVVSNNIYCTDEELVFLVNEKLPKNSQIKYETFRAYKNGNRQSNNPLAEKFVTLIKKALINEKMALLNELKEGGNGWQAKAWILERKFSEWNLKHISETDITTKGESLNDLSKMSTDELLKRANAIKTLDE